MAPKRLYDKKEVKVFRDIFLVPSFYLPGWPYPTLRSVSVPIDMGCKIHSIIRKGNFDIIHVHGHHYPISWLAINAAHKQGIPSILTMHGMYALSPSVMGGETKLEQYFNKFIFSRILERTTAVIGLTKQITMYGRKFGKESIKFFTIPNGVNCNLYRENISKKLEYRAKYNLNAESIVILFSGRFERVKGVLEFARAAKNIVRTKGKAVEVVMVGTGSLESEIKSIFQGVQGVHILEWQRSDVIHEIYIVSDIFVNPSKFEALPITIVEAMNAHLHIVYTPVGGVPDILEEYSQKTMLKHATTDEIQKVLINLMTDLNSTTKSGNSLANAERFDWNTIADSVNKAYRDVLNPS